MVEISRRKQRLSVVKMTSFFEQVRILVEPHRSSNYFKSVVTYRSLLHITLEEIKTELTKQSVIDVVRLMRMESGKKVSTALLVSTFIWHTYGTRTYLCRVPAVDS